MQASAADYILFYHPEMTFGYLNGRRPDHRKVQGSYASYTWLLLVQLHI
jgi:hypothetical protein